MKNVWVMVLVCYLPSLFALGTLSEQSGVQQRRRAVVLGERVAHAVVREAARMQEDEHGQLSERMSYSDRCNQVGTLALFLSAICCGSICECCGCNRLLSSLRRLCAA